MRSQKVGVDVWKMVCASCSYLSLAFAAWVLIKLVYACFWFPTFLTEDNNRKQEANKKVYLNVDAQKPPADQLLIGLGKEISDQVLEEVSEADKKND